MSGNGNLSYPESIFIKLYQDLCVKMKLIRALFKGHLSQGFAGIGPEAGVVFGELHSERPVFDDGEEIVAASKAMIKMPTRFMPAFYLRSLARRRQRTRGRFLEERLKLCFSPLNGRKASL